MRPFLFVVLPLAIFVFAANTNGADRAKRIAEIEKEIADLEAKIGALRAELVTLQPPSKEAPHPREREEVSGTIDKLIPDQGEPFGFSLQDVIVYFRADVEFTFSDKQKATVADLKVGRIVTASVDGRYRFQKRDPPIAWASRVVIHKAK